MRSLPRLPTLHMKWLERLCVQSAERREVQARYCDRYGLHAVEGETRSHRLYREKFKLRD